MPRPLREAWLKGINRRLDHALTRPFRARNGVYIHFLGVFHDDPISGHQVCAALQALQPSAVALELPLEVVAETLGVAMLLPRLIKKLAAATFNDHGDLFRFFSEEDHEMWNRANSSVSWKPLETDYEAGLGNMPLAEILPALAWCKANAVVADGIDLDWDCPQRRELDLLDSMSSESDDICITSFEKVLGRKLVRIARGWADATCLSLDRDVAVDMMHQALLATLTSQELVRFVGHKRKRHTQYYGAVLDKRDAHMAGRLRTLYTDPEFLAANPPPCRILAIVGSGHVEGITTQLDLLENAAG